jgi:hypothetical protein
MEWYLRNVCKLILQYTVSNCRSRCCWYVVLKNVVFWDAALCRSCVSWRFGGIYRLHLQGRKIRERGTSVSRWLQAELQFATRCWPSTQTLSFSSLLISHLTTLPFSLFSCRWLFPTEAVGSLLLTLVPRSRIFLLWRWRRYVPPKRRLMLHSATPQKTTPLCKPQILLILFCSQFLCKCLEGNLGTKFRRF